MRVYLSKGVFSHRTVSFLVDYIFQNLAENKAPDPSMHAMLVFFDAVQAIYIDFFMSKQGITSMEHQSVVNLLRGLRFFVEWYNDVRAISLPPQKLEKHCMALVTVVELIVTCVGALEFMKWRFTTKPGSVVYPRRLSQSALEAAFGYIRSFLPSGTTLMSFKRGYASINFLKEAEEMAKLEERYLGGQHKDQR
jgi:hypothetical protein